MAAWYEARLGQMAREAAATREQLARSEAELRAELDSYRAALELLRDPGTRVVELRGQGAAAEALGRFLWSDGGGGLLLATKLPPAPPGKTYGLWTVAADGARPAGIFAPDASGRAMLRVAARSANAPVRGLFVTVEPESGVPAPTGAVVLAPR